MAQDTKFIPDNEFSFIIGPEIGTIKNKNIKDDKYANPHSKLSGINAGINYSTYFNRSLGVVIGLEFNQFKKTVDYKGTYKSETTYKDPFNDDYYLTIESDYTDKYKVNTIDVPLALRLQKGNDKFQAFADLGIRTHIILIAKFEETGTYEKKGAYPTQYSNVFVVLEDDWYYGFTKSVYTTNQDMQVKRLSFSANINFGLKAKMTETLFMVFSAGYTYGLTDIMNENGKVEYINLFKEKVSYQKTSLEQFALRAGIGYNF